MVSHLRQGFGGRARRSVGFFLSLFLVFGCSVLSPQSSLAAPVTVAWDANAESDLAGYRVHWGQASRTYSQSQDVGNQTSVLIELPAGTWFGAVTAYDLAGNESGFSNEVSTTIAPQPPQPPPIVGPSTPQPTTLSDGSVRWDWPACQGCAGYLYRWGAAEQQGEGATAERSVTIPNFQGTWFCVTAEETGWGTNDHRCNSYTPPPPDVTPPTPPTGTRIIIETSDPSPTIRVEPR